MKYVQMHRGCFQAIHFITKRCIEYPAYSTGQCHQELFHSSRQSKCKSIDKLEHHLEKLEAQYDFPLESCRKIACFSLPMFKINCWPLKGHQFKHMGTEPDVTHKPVAPHSYLTISQNIPLCNLVETKMIKCIYCTEIETSHCFSNFIPLS